MSDSGKICDNPKCAYHIRINAKDAIAPHIYVTEGGERTRVDRHLYRSNSGDRLFLCDVCHEAVRITNNPRQA